MSKLLTISQKATLAILSRKAYDHQLAKGETHGLTADQFRKVAVITATEGKAQGLTSATDDQYRRITTYLTGLLEGDEFWAAMAEGTEGRERVLYRIDKAMTAGRFGPAYVATICRNRWGVGENWRDDLTEAQLVNLSQTLERNAATRKAKAKKAA